MILGFEPLTKTSCEAHVRLFHVAIIHVERIPASINSGAYFVLGILSP